MCPGSGLAWALSVWSELQSFMASRPPDKRTRPPELLFKHYFFQVLFQKEPDSVKFFANMGGEWHGAGQIVCGGHSLQFTQRLNQCCHPAVRVCAGTIVRDQVN